MWPEALAAATVARSLTRTARAAVVKGWRDGPTRTAHGDYDLMIADYWAPHVQVGLGALWTRTTLTAATRSARQVLPKATDRHGPDSHRTLVASVAAGHLRMVQADTAPLRSALRGTWADGWTAGTHVADQQVAAATKAPRAHVQTVEDWDTWTPGDVEAALQSAGGGLRRLLDTADLRLADLTETTVDRLGSRIAAGLLTGDSIETIAGNLRDLLGGDDARALAIAHTETAWAMTQASLTAYGASDGLIGGFDWLTTTGACPACADAESRNPHGLGDPAPPGHTFCRCAPAPVVSIDGARAYATPQ